MTNLPKQVPAPHDNSTRNSQSGRFELTVARVDQYGVRICTRHNVPMVPTGPKQTAFQCRVCAKERHDKWQADNHDDAIRQRREYYAANRDRILAEQHANYISKPRQRQLRLPGPPKMATCHPDQRHVGKGFCKKCYDLDYQKRHLDEHNAAAKEWSERNPNYKASWHRLRRYGLTPEQCRQMFEKQNGLCAICKVGPAEHIDHDHATNKNRGLLCGNCNRGLGLFKDNPEFLVAAALYLSVGTVQ